MKMSKTESNGGMLTFGGHLEVFRRMLFRIIAVVIVLACIIFYYKTETFEILLAPKGSHFVTFKFIEQLLQSLGVSFHFQEYDIPLINTELSSQFMTHITVSCILAVLLASPYIVMELFRFISPALYERERRYSYLVAFIIYALFLLGLLMSYFVLFPISFHFLGNYQVSNKITNTITLDSYVSNFTTLVFLMGIVFQLPVIAYVLGKMGFISASLLKKYRPHALTLIMVIAAIITPPDLFTLIIVTLPIYALYEVSILILKKVAGGDVDEDHEYSSSIKHSES